MFVKNKFKNVGAKKGNLNKPTIVNFFKYMIMNSDLLIKLHRTSIVNSEKLEFNELVIKRRRCIR